MTEQKVEELIEEFTQAAKSHYVASLAGDWRTANKEVAKIRKTIKRLRSLGENARVALLAQTDSQDLSVSSMAAVYSLKYAPEKSISVLTRIAKEPGLIGFEAEQALQRWKEGEWNLEE
jgi:hypothetical protein